MQLTLLRAAALTKPNVPTCQPLPTCTVTPVAPHEQKLQTLPNTIADAATLSSLHTVVNLPTALRTKTVTRTAA